MSSLIDRDDVVTCLRVVQEVLRGFDNEHAYLVTHDSMLALPIVESPLDEAVMLHAVDLYRRVRRTGLTIRSDVECPIAACAQRHNLTILHNDRDIPGHCEDFRPPRAADPFPRQAPGVTIASG